MDTVTKEKRSAIMRAVRSRDTKPEIVVRCLVHRLGYRFRLHRSDLPGKPDLAFISRKKVIFVNGCFWHAHTCARGNRLPATNRAYWEIKIGKNRERDRRHNSKLRARGWEVLTVWECDLKDEKKLIDRLCLFLDQPHKRVSPCHAC